MAGLTKDLCFICLTRLPNTIPQFILKRRKEIWYKFFTLVSRYIENNDDNNISSFEFIGTGATLSKHFSTNFIPNIGNNPVEKHCCKSCLSSLVEFCEVYDKIQVLHLELVRILDKIRNSISDDLRVNDETKSYGFREKFFDKIEQKRKRLFPRITLDDIDDANYEPHIINLNTIIDDPLNFPTQQSGVTVKQEGVVIDSGSTEIEQPDAFWDTFVDENEIKKTGDNHNLDNASNDDNDHDYGDHMENSENCKNVQIESLLGFHGDFHSGDVSSDNVFAEEAPGPVERHHQHQQSQTLEKPHIQTPGPRQIFSCPMCPMRIQNQSWFILHLRTHTNERPFHCRKCQKEFRRLSFLRDHVRQSHQNIGCPSGSGSTSTATPVMCEICGRSLVDRAGLKKHIFQVHSGVKRFKCVFEDCTRAFCHKRDLHRHRRIHTNEKPFVCDLCPMAFKQPFDVTKHKRLCHNDGSLPPLVQKPKERKFGCEICGKKFLERANLIRHRSGVHRDIFPGEREKMMKYKCPHESCEKKFIFRHELQMHLRKHTGERPYQCNLCEKSFMLRPNLKKHLLSHSADRPFLCVQCGKSFKRKNHLKEHEKTHIQTVNELAAPI